MSKAELFEKAMNGIDEKYINEAAEELYKRQGEEIRVTDNRTAKPQKNSGLKMFLGVAAAIALVAGGFAVLNHISENEISVERPSDSSVTGDKVIKYDRVTISDEHGWFTEIYPDIWDDYAVLAVELVENLEKITLTQTDYIPYSTNETDETSIKLFYGNESDEYVITNCYADGTLDRTIITKNGVRYEASGDELIRVREITAELMKTAVPALMSGEYYLSDDSGMDVYIEVKNGVICLKGDDDLDFVKANCGDYNYNDLYMELGDNEFVISSLDATPAKMGIITDWDKDKKVNANRYQGLCHYYFEGTTMDGPVINLLDHYFVLKAPECIEYEDTFAKGTIRFAKVKNADIYDLNKSALPIGSETEAKEYFNKISQNSTGIDRFGFSILSEYEYVEDESFCNAMGDSAVPNDYAHLRFAVRDTELYRYTGSRIDVFVGQEGCYTPKNMLKSGTGLVFDENDDTVSEFTLDDGTVLNVKIGGVIDDFEYYVAEWTDEARGLQYAVTGRGCSRSDFTGAVISLIYDVDGIGHLTAAKSELPTNFADYEMDFQIFYDYFRGVWSDENQNEITIGWNDNVFSYDAPLIGFFKDADGAYMAQQYGNDRYNLYFVPEYDKNTLFYYNYIFADTPYSSGDEKEVYNINGDRRVTYTKTSEGRYVQNTGVYGYLGIQELCASEGISFDALHNFSFKDYEGKHWSRHNDTVFNDWGKIGVLNRSKGGENLTLALKFLSGDGVTTQYFLCYFQKNADGTLTLTDTPYKFDISEMDLESSQTENAIALRKNEEAARENGTEGYYPDANYLVYRVSEDSYYLIRQAGMNQAQWKTYIDIFWYSGEIFDYRDYEPVMYKQVDCNCGTILGNVFACMNDGYLYLLGENHDTNEYYITCIYEGEVISRYDMGCLDLSYVTSFGAYENRTINVLYWTDNADRKTTISIDFSDPYNPVLIDIQSDYKNVDETGEKVDRDRYLSYDYNNIAHASYIIPENQAEKLILKPDQTLILSSDDGTPFELTQNDFRDIVLNVNGNDTSSIEIGHICENVIHSVYLGPIETIGKWKFSGMENGEYLFTVTNCGAEDMYIDSFALELMEENAILSGYSYVSDVGDRMNKPTYTMDNVSGKPFLSDDIYLIKASKAEKLMLRPYETLIFAIDENGDYKHSSLNTAWFSFNFAELGTKSTVSVGAMNVDGIYGIYNGAAYGGNNDFTLTDNLPDGEYRFFITNTSEHVQYYNFIGIAVADGAESDVSSVSDESDAFSLESLENSKYYDLLLKWFDENGIGGEERANLLNDIEFRKDVMRDSYWE